MNNKPLKYAAWRHKTKNWGSYWNPNCWWKTITKAVASNLNMGRTNNTESSPSGFVSKPYLGRPCPSQLALGVDSSLDPTLTCRYCKDTRHLKENCVKLTQHLTWDKQEPRDGGISKSDNETTKNVPPKNYQKKEN